MNRARVILVAIGVLLLAWGVFVLFDSVRPARIPGLALWLGAAIVLHDVVVAPIIFAGGILIRRAGHRLTGTTVLVVQGAIVVGSLISLIAVPLIIAQAYAPNNPTVLPFDYGARLGAFWVFVAVTASAVSAVLYARTRRANERPSSRQS
ncbi:MAG: hypothetical protein ABIX44_03115 [Cryobacterium sp.]